MVHTSAVCSLRYEALGKFREHSRVALGYASSNSYASFIHSKLPHASYLNDYMLTYEPIVTKKEKTFFSSSCPLETLFTVCSVFCWWKDDYLMFDTILNNFFFIQLIVFLFCFFSSGDLFSQNRFAGITGALLCLYHLTPKCD